MDRESRADHSENDTTESLANLGFGTITVQGLAEAQLETASSAEKIRFLRNSLSQRGKFGLLVAFVSRRSAIPAFEQLFLRRRTPA